MKIDELNTARYETQEQQPNPTLIDTFSVASGDESADGSTKIGKTVVFTSYKHESGEKAWYPSVFFHDLDKNKSSWQIHGAEIFVSIEKVTATKVQEKAKKAEDKDKPQVTVIANEIWYQLSQGEYELIVKASSNEFYRHKEYSNYLIKLKYEESVNLNSFKKLEKEKTMLNF